MNAAMKFRPVLQLAPVLGVLLGCSTAQKTDTPALAHLMKPLRCMDGPATDSVRRVSSAEVNGVKLEVEQPSGLRNEIQIRVRDFAAHSRQQNEVSCDLYYMGDNGKEFQNKFLSVTLKRKSSNSDEYSGGASNRVEFEHGNKFKVVYRSNGLPLPISTWYACYYH